MKILIDEQKVQQGVKRLADEISQTFGDSRVTVIGIMTGSILLVADMVRLLKMPLRVGVVQASSYEGTERRKIQINSDMMPDVAGEDVLLVDDIFDTGHTLTEMVALMKGLGANSVRAAVLLSKTDRHEVPLRPDFVAFDIPDAFVVGYGLDYNDHYRHLPYIATLEQQDIERIATK